MVSGAYKSEYGDSDEITQCLNEVAVSCTYMYIRVLIIDVNKNIVHKFRMLSKKSFIRRCNVQLISNPHKGGKQT